MNTQQNTILPRTRAEIGRPGAWIHITTHDLRELMMAMTAEEMELMIVAINDIAGKDETAIYRGWTRKGGDNQWLIQTQHPTTKKLSRQGEGPTITEALEDWFEDNPPKWYAIAKAHRNGLIYEVTLTSTKKRPEISYKEGECHWVSKACESRLDAAKALDKQTENENGRLYLLPF